MNHDATNNTAHTPDNQPRAAHGALWASAALILALIIVQIGRLVPFSNANASSVTQVAGLTVLTAHSADSEEIVCILDTRAERLLVYGVLNRNQVELHQTIDVAALFTDARNAAGATRQRR